MTEPPDEIFPDQSTERMWRASWCDTCFQPAEARHRLQGKGSGCPILAEALSGKLPPQWDGNLRRRGLQRLAEALPDKLYSCSAYLKRPPVYRRGRAKAEGPQEGLFPEPEHGSKSLVRVDGWPDYRAGEHLHDGGAERHEARGGWLCAWERRRDK